MVLIDLPTAAVRWGVSIRTIRRWLVAGKLTDHGTPGQPRVDLWADHERAPQGRKRAA